MSCVNDDVPCVYLLGHDQTWMAHGISFLRPCHLCVDRDVCHDLYFCYLLGFGSGVGEMRSVKIHDVSHHASLHDGPPCRFCVRDGVTLCP